MRVSLVASAPPGRPQLFTSYLLDGAVAIDAGCLDRAGDLDALAAIKHIFLSHAHLDHVAALPPLLDAVYDGSGDCPTVYGHPHTLDCLRRDVFNDRLYPDFVRLSAERPPFLKLRELTPGERVNVAGLRITPVEVSHVIPALGYVVEEDYSAAVFPGDTAPTDEIWNVARRCANLRAVFLECTFPGPMEWLAELAQHLTPARYAGEMAKLGRPVRYITVHVHARHRDAVAAELEALGLPGVEIGEPGVTYLLG
jgi:ribonuclease BN (tRNA processing enzyme)